MTEAPDLTVEVHDSRLHLVQTLKSMRYSETLDFTHITDAVMTADEETFLDTIDTYLFALNEILRVAASSTTDMLAELNELRQQRKAVRDFLGLTPTPGET